ncbi:MAG: adventurous gliding motility protein CglE [Deltaproteobacteria bacterium]|nr:adventurous gliding motility protein CglE [Deltaproteobacteria bacterium]
MSPILFAFVLVSAEPASAPAEGGDSDIASGLQSEGVQKAKYSEIERGFSLRLPIGMLAYLTQVQAANGSPPFSKQYLPGLLIGAELAYDVLPILDIGGFFYFSNAQGTGTGVIRDMNTIMGGLMVHLSFFHTDRVYLGAKVGVGYGMQDTNVERLQHGLGIIGGLTLEYYTRIRHFSVAIDAGVLAWLVPIPISVALAVIPAVRYTF